MSSIMRWRSGLMGLSDIAKLLSRIGLNPTILRQGRALALSFRSRRPPAVPGRPYRASGLVLGSIWPVRQALSEWPVFAHSRRSLRPSSLRRLRTAEIRTRSERESEMLRVVLNAWVTKTTAAEILANPATRRRQVTERAMQRFRSMKTLQKFSSVHAQVHNHFNQ